MKKYLPFILPAIALALVVFFAYRGYTKRTEERPPLPEVTAGTEIEELSVSELELLENLQQGVGDFKTAPMDGMTGMGEIRYHINDNKAFISVNANLPTEQGEIYQLWLKEAGATDFIAQDNLTGNKGGLLVSVVVAIDKLPILLEVRRGETVVLRGEVAAEN